MHRVLFTKLAGITPMAPATDRKSRHSRLFDLYRQEADSDASEVSTPAPLPAALSAEDIAALQSKATNSLARPTAKRSFWKRLTG